MTFSELIKKIGINNTLARYRLMAELLLLAVYTGCGQKSNPLSYFANF